MNGRQIRIAMLAGGALLCAGIAASQVSGRERQIRAQVGPLVPVVVAAQDIAVGDELAPDGKAPRLVVRRVPARFAPATALRGSADVDGLRAAVAIAAGDYITASSLSGGDRPGEQASNGRRRLVQISVAGGVGVLEASEPGSLVDVVVTAERGGRAHSYLALQRAELVTAGPSNGQTGEGQQSADSVATLKVSLKAAVLLTAAQNFAREIRLIPRAGGDDRILAATTVAATELRP